MFLPHLPERCYAVILDPKLFASLLDQRGDPEVVALGHIWEEVMGRVMVEPTGDDVPEPTVCAVVTRGSHLKLSPVNATELTVVYIVGKRKLKKLTLIITLVSMFCIIF